MELLLLLSLVGAGAAFGAFGSDSGNSDDGGDGTDGGGSSDKNDDYIPGTDDADTIAANKSSTAHGFGGEDKMSGFGSAQIYGDIGDDTITVSHTATGWGGYGDDAIAAAGNSTAFGGNGEDEILGRGNISADGGADNDAMLWSAQGDGDSASLSGGDGDDRLQALGALDGTVTASGGTGDDLILVNGGGLAIGGFGADTLSGSNGSTLEGGIGRDLFVARPDGTDYSDDDPTDALTIADFTKGQDRVVVDLDGTPASMALTSDADGTTLTITWATPPNADNDGTATIRFDGAQDLTISDFKFVQGSAIVTAPKNLLDFSLEIGTAYDLTTGTAGNDLLISGGGDVTLSAGAGNDLVFGGEGGTDVVDLGSGNDSFSAGSSLADVTGGDGNDSFEALADAAVTGQQFEIISFDGGNGNDTAHITGAEPTGAYHPPAENARYDLIMGDGNDTVTIDRDVEQFVSIDGGAGQDSITFWMGESATGGSGSDAFHLNVASEDLPGEIPAAVVKDMDADDTLVIQIESGISGSLRTEFVPFDSGTGLGGYNAFYIGGDMVLALFNKNSTDAADAILATDPRLTITYNASFS